MGITITGTGSYIPKEITSNKDFENHDFYNEDGTSFAHQNDVIIEKFKAITGISERRYAQEKYSTSDIASFAAQKAIDYAKIDPETIDYIIVAHNYGDVKYGSNQSDTVPSLASRVKSNLQIENPSCVAYDLIFGCPGWLEAMIQANAFIKAGIAKKCLVIGAETLSRVTDPHDRDSMIYSDGAGATIIEHTNDTDGIISHATATHAIEEANYIYFGNSNNLEDQNPRKYIKMNGRKIYNFALTNVPKAMKSCLEDSGYDIKDLKKILIHQANEKMDEAIVKRFYGLYDMQAPQDIMPMTIGTLGNSSVATVPTLYDLIVNNNMEGHSINKGDLIMFASVGAGMNINAMVYKA
ncbi:ketoacyl-ACP synthase III [Flavobacteriaceae bacterium]|jgi:3-oxoacyl-[acyl-carrier-protein] synthase-3|nr:ketoacyl-ACP synthase III [Flavobacteriaceae bacterium]MDA9307644.1 ketoacyl-ACP synthase III [Flavobacteriaceae bacterium]MDA9310099.1 ketoacyl-ACP synthase III [Flavobacteriaceae bacterium]MDB4027825.1 ketoacyl-ACP synthase III [Flavobacteriaceae bacterium]MDB4114694.1 ketoacyl-ACP synthase III [Flavobacteriaceae bacterium]